MPLTDYHQQIRDAVAKVMEGFALGPEVHTLDDIEGNLPSAPAIVVVCVGPEQNRPEFSTNRQTGLGFPVTVALLSAGVANGAKSPEAPDATAFRRAVYVAFDMKRLADVPEVAFCEVSGAALILDKEGAAFQKLSIYLTVVAVGRFPRS